MCALAAGVGHAPASPPPRPPPPRRPADLENKRQQFPRFYFLSNDDLLEILGQSKDPLQVQKHIKKCFEGIQTLNMIEPGAQGNRTVEALGMNAPDGEKVPFERKVLVEGPVELWLLEVEKCMKLALQKILSGTIAAARGKDKGAWGVSCGCGAAASLWPTLPPSSQVDQGLPRPAAHLVGH